MVGAGARCASMIRPGMGIVAASCAGEVSIYLVCAFSFVFEGAGVGFAARSFWCGVPGVPSLVRRVRVWPYVARGAISSSGSWNVHMVAKAGA